MHTHALSSDHSIRNLSRILSNRADVRIFKEHLPFHEGKGGGEAGNGRQEDKRKNLILDSPALERLYNVLQNEKCRNHRSTHVDSCIGKIEQVYCLQRKIPVSSLLLLLCSIL